MCLTYSFFNLLFTVFPCSIVYSVMGNLLYFCIKWYLIVEKLWASAENNFNQRSSFFVTVCCWDVRKTHRVSLPLSFLLLFHSVYRITHLPPSVTAPLQTLNIPPPFPLYSEHLPWHYLNILQIFFFFFNEFLFLSLFITHPVALNYQWLFAE